jgi:voltage-gated potassium channel Kch
VIDAIYFSMATMSTVGYGDFAPGDISGYAKLFTAAFILVGIAGPFLIISIELGKLLGMLEHLFRRLFNRLVAACGWAKASAVDLDGDGTADYIEPPSALHYYARGFSFWILLLFQINFGSAGVLYALLSHYRADEARAHPTMLPADYVLPAVSYWDALYHCWVTATTVGYGDVFMRSQAARAWSSLHIAIAVATLGAFLGKAQDLLSEREHQLKRVEMLKRQLDRDLILSLDADGNGVDKFEFVVGMLIKLELISIGDVEPFVAQFEALDADGSGKLNSDDLELLVKQKQEARAESIAAKAARDAAARKSMRPRRYSVGGRKPGVGGDCASSEAARVRECAPAESSV